jgi:hypothetical protein
VFASIVRFAYVAQSAAASFNPAHKLLDQCIEASIGHQIAADDDPKRNDRSLIYRASRLMHRAVGELRQAAGRNAALWQEMASCEASSSGRRRRREQGSAWDSRLRAAACGRPAAAGKKDGGEEAWIEHGPHLSARCGGDQ